MHMHMHNITFFGLPRATRATVLAGALGWPWEARGSSGGKSCQNHMFLCKKLHARAYGLDEMSLTLTMCRACRQKQAGELARAPSGTLMDILPSRQNPYRDTSVWEIYIYIYIYKYSGTCRGRSCALFWPSSFVVTQIH